MKTISYSQMQGNLESTLDSAQGESVLILRDGKPYAVVRGIADYDEEDLRLACSPSFWRLIEERRQNGSSIPLEDVERQLRAKEQTQSPKRKNRARKPSPTKRVSKR